MVERYGNFVTYDPPITAEYISAMDCAIIACVVRRGFLLRRKPKTQSAVKSQEVLTDEDNARLAELLNKDK